MWEGTKTNKKIPTQKLKSRGVGIIQRMINEWTQDIDKLENVANLNI
jgi:hypothetical protein